MLTAIWLTFFIYAGMFSSYKDKNNNGKKTTQRNRPY